VVPVGLPGFAGDELAALAEARGEAQEPFRPPVGVGEVVTVEELRLLAVLGDPDEGLLQAEVGRRLVVSLRISVGRLLDGFSLGVQLRDVVLSRKDCQGERAAREGRSLGERAVGMGVAGDPTFSGTLVRDEEGF